MLHPPNLLMPGSVSSIAVMAAVLSSPPQLSLSKLKYRCKSCASLSGGSPGTKAPALPFRVTPSTHLGLSITATMNMTNSSMRAFIITCSVGTRHKVMPEVSAYYSQCCCVGQYQNPTSTCLPMPAATGHAYQQVTD
jgi:hypothetical protein